MKHMKNILLFLFSVLFSISSNVFGIELVYDVYKVDKPAPTVIIGHACGGLAVGHETSWARQLNRWGFNVVHPMRQSVAVRTGLVAAVADDMQKSSGAFAPVDFLKIHI